MADASPRPEAGIEALVTEAARGDEAAMRCLFESQRDRLRRMIAARLDRRLSPRLDASDVVQETLADAARRLPDYLRDRPLPFFPWLFRLAADRLARTHRDHVVSGVRAIGREERLDGPSHDEAAAPRRGERLATHETTPGRRLVREERQQFLAAALEKMDDADRVILGLRYIDRMPFDEIAVVLGIGLGAAKMRHLRALERLRRRLEEMGVEPSTAP